MIDVLRKYKIMKIEAILHFMVCYFIADTSYNFLPPTIGIDLYWQTIIPKLIAVTIACLFGIGKELWDKVS